MELEQKHLSRINRLACTINVSVAITLIIFAILQFLGSPGIRPIIRLALVLSNIVVNVVMVKKMEYSTAYRHVCVSSMGVLYILVLATSTVPYMYVVAFPIAVMVMLFQDKRITMLSSITAMISCFVYNVVCVVNGYSELDQAIITFMMLAVVCLLGPKISDVQVKNTEENLEVARSQAEAQSKTSASIVELAAQLTDRFTRAKEVSESLNVSMDDSHTAVSEIAESTRVNAEAITQQTEQTSDIQQSIQEVGEQARHMGELSENTNATVEQGVALIERLKEQATEVVKINQETKATTAQLNESIKDVEAITETILGISSQTNLLALNASIEAARAGEAGKGFAVVADEIRNLAEDTRVATEKIGEIISKLTIDAESAADSMTKSAEYAAKQNELITETGDKLTDIKTDTDGLYTDVKQVTASVENIIAANGIIMNSITDLSATGQQVAASTDTALSLSDSTMDALGNMNGLLEEINTIATDMEKVAAE